MEENEKLSKLEIDDLKNEIKDLKQEIAKFKQHIAERKSKNSEFKSGGNMFANFGLPQAGKIFGKMFGENQNGFAKQINNLISSSGFGGGGNGFGFDAGFIGKTMTKVMSNFFAFNSRATGGNISVGRNYLVGERGPEIIRSSSAGSVFSANMHQKKSNAPVNINISLDNSSNNKSSAQQAKELISTINKARRYS